MASVTKVFSAICYAAQQGRLERAMQLAPKMVKVPAGEESLMKGLEALCRRNLSHVDIDPFTLEELNRAGKAFREIRLAQARGVDANSVII